MLCDNPNDEWWLEPPDDYGGFDEPGFDRFLEKKFPIVWEWYREQEDDVIDFLEPFVTEFEGGSCWRDNETRFRKEQNVFLEKIKNWREEWQLDQAALNG